MSSTRKKLKARVVILSGPSGAGKTTLHDRLLSSPRWKGRVVRSVSATTRKPRGKERHGREYLFLSPRMFAYKARTGQFLEWARVFDHCYGTPMKAVRENLRQGRSVLLCIDVQGARAVRRRIPKALSIFVQTPTMKELERRLKGRGTDPAEAIRLRLKTAAKEMKEAPRYDQVIVNDDLDRAFRDLETVLERELL
ncbi:MAG: guanylate kinase [Elusimicrobia bacterium]|nr:guanylate kinase [Elusimicrobiota bacterium]